MFLDSYDHIIWDWNGTLLDDAWLCLEIVNGTLSRRDMPPLSAERYAEIFGFPVIDYYRKLGFNFDTEPFDIAATEFISAYEKRRPECELREGGAEVLAHIQSRQIGQSIISSSQQDNLLEAVAHLQLSSIFDGLFGLSDHHAGGKITVAQTWLGSQSISPERILLLGDTLHDLETARAIGVSCCLIGSGHQSVERLTAGGVPIIRTLKELLL